MVDKQLSPYLSSPNRLADVIAAIQATATYKFYKLDFKGWADRISGEEAKAEHWRTVFVEHPESFRLDSNREKASLVWRRQHQKRYSIDHEQVISRDDYYALSDTSRISRTPLGADEIAILVETATNLHSRALEQQREKRWWVPTVTALLGVLLGSMITALAK